MDDQAQIFAKQDANINKHINALVAGWEQGLYAPGEFLNRMVELAILVDEKALPIIAG